MPNLPSIDLSVVLGLTAVILAVVGWFMVYYLSVRQSKREREYDIKKDNYPPILSLLGILSRMMTAILNMYEIDLKKKEEVVANVIKLVAMITSLQNRDAYSRFLDEYFLNEKEEEGNNELEKDDKADEKNKTTEEEDDEKGYEEFVEKMESLKNQLTLEITREIVETSNDLNEYINCLKALGIGTLVRKKTEEVIETISGHLGSIGSGMILDGVGLKGFYKPKTKDDWIKKTIEDIETLQTLMVKDSQSTFNLITSKKEKK